MRVRWKLLGLAGVAGVAASGAVVVRRRRSQQEYDPDALRGRLHERLAESRGSDIASDAPRGAAPGGALAPDRPPSAA